jgi:hypothetical protein
VNHVATTWQPRAPWIRQVYWRSSGPMQAGIGQRAELAHDVFGQPQNPGSLALAMETPEPQKNMTLPSSRATKR